MVLENSIIFNSKKQSYFDTYVLISSLLVRMCGFTLQGREICGLQDILMRPANGWEAGVPRLFDFHIA